MLFAIQSYLDTLAAQFYAGNATEHTHRPALHQLLTTLLPNHRITHEPRRIACGAPDFEIAFDDIPIGHLEAKDIGTDLNKAQKSEQLQRYLPSLHNLLLTDYLEFRWFVEGELQPVLTVKLATLTKAGKLVANPQAFPKFSELLQHFVTTQVLTLHSPEELAKRMAHIARLMNTVMLQAYQQEDRTGQLHEQLSGMHRILLNTLTPEQFADMLAQTICYGLFAAKCSLIEHPLSRLTANHFVPKTNPFLRSLFNQIAGVELDVRLVWMVEHLVAVLNRVDIAAILDNFGKRTRQEDPVIHFYETFLTHYDAKLREVRGVYYTPAPVVSYIVHSVDEILKDTFGLKQGLADNTQLTDQTHKVHILDPATGTGTFLAAVIDTIYERFQKNQGMWSDYVSHHLLPRLHGFELLMAPYTVAHLKLSLQLKASGYDFSTEERLRVFLTNTLEEAHDSYEQLSFSRWLSEEAKKANLTKREMPVMVILGNPPYSGHSANTGEWINNLLHGIGDKSNYFQVDGQSLNERNPKWLNDDYVKFIRFAQWRIEKTGYGILGFVTNHSYLDNPTFRGMRQALLQTFDEIYILDLHGNSKKGEIAPDGGVDQNVFDIQQGVAIGIFIKYQHGKKTQVAKIHHAEIYGQRAAKYRYLMENTIKTTAWTELQPQSPFYLFIPQQTDLLAEYQQGWKVTEIMPINGTGMISKRDSMAFQPEKNAVKKIVMDIIQLSTDEIIYKYPLSSWQSRDGKVEYVKASVMKFGVDDKRFIKTLYRPFDIRWTYYTPESKGFIAWPVNEVMQHLLLGENLGLITCRQQSQRNLTWGLVGVTNLIMESCAISNKTKEINTLFPLYIYPTEKDNFINGNGNGNGHHNRLARKPNFSESFVRNLETRLNLKFISEGCGDFKNTISALDVFYYIYAIFHSPTYRQRYAEFLKLDFPRLPLTQDTVLFKQLAELGEQLVKIHLMEADIATECCFPIKGSNVVEKVIYKENRVYINTTQYFDYVTAEIWEFHIGGYQVCEKWLKDRKGKMLGFEACSQYLYILAAIEKTQILMEHIDEIAKFPL